MVYVPTTSAGKTIHEVMGELNTAQHQWNTYATQLGRCYTTAYGNHMECIGKINDELRLKSEQAYWILSLFCVAFAGGLAGGLLAPWVSGAGAEATKIMLRNKTSVMAGNVVQGVVQKVTDIAKPQTTQFKPAVKDPLAYWQDMLGELGICFSNLRDEVEQDMEKADKAQSSADAAETVKKYMDLPLVKDSPESKDMPSLDVVPREVEVGMWIAWAAGRDIGYWKRAVTELTKGSWDASDYLRDCWMFDPVLNRLSTISNAAYQASKFEGRVGNLPGPNLGVMPLTTLINIPGLAEAGNAIPSLSGATLFLRRVKDVVKSPQNVLPQLDQTPPAYKK